MLLPPIGLGITVGAVTPVVELALTLNNETNSLAPAGIPEKVAFRRVPKSAKPAVPPATGMIKPDSELYTTPGMFWPAPCPCAALAVLVRGATRVLKAEPNPSVNRTVPRNPAVPLVTSVENAELVHCCRLVGVKPGAVLPTNALLLVPVEANPF